MCQNWLDFDHSRYVELTYGDELSATNHALFYEGSSVGSDAVDCECQKKTEGRLLIKFSKTFSTGNYTESSVLIDVEYRVIKKAILVKENSRGTKEKHAIDYMTMHLNDFKLENISKIMGVVKLKLPVGFTGTDKTIHFRFRCTEDNISDID